jgi:polysaccharide export outer membrane protein
MTLQLQLPRQTQGMKSMFTRNRIVGFAVVVGLLVTAMWWSRVPFEHSAEPGTFDVARSSQSAELKSDDYWNAVATQSPQSPQSPSPRPTRLKGKVLTLDRAQAELPSYPSFAYLELDVNTTDKIQLAKYQQDCFGTPIETEYQGCNPVPGHSAAPVLDCSGNSDVVKPLIGIDEATNRRLCREPNWHDSSMVPWEMFAYGEYIGPHRTPHVAEYRLRVNDQLEFVYLLTREQTIDPYQVYVGDVIQIRSAVDSSLNQENIRVLSDGTTSLPLIGKIRIAGRSIEDLQNELNSRYTKFVNNPSLIVQVTQSDTPLQDLLNSVDARYGTGGQSRMASVAPDGTVQLPMIGSVPAVGLTLTEIRREVNARYRARLRGVDVTPILSQRAPRYVFVVGQVESPGRYEMTGPTTALQAIALAQGDLQSSNLRNVVVFRRDEQWRLMATRLDLSGAIHGRRPYTSDEIYLRDSDIVLVPRKPIQRLSEAVDLYLTRTLYAIFPEEVVFDFNSSL